MLWLPDTNVWIEILKRPGCRAEQQLLAHSPRDIVFCSVVKAELWHGAYKYGRTDRRLAVLDSLFSHFVSLPFDDDAARIYAEIRHQLETVGQVIGPNDLKIAAICCRAKATLVTANTREFRRISNLTCEDWSNAKD